MNNNGFSGETQDDYDYLYDRKMANQVEKEKLNQIKKES